MPQLADAGAVLRRAHQAWFGQITEQTPLDCGVALTCPAHPTVPDGNQIREVVLGASQTAESAVDEVETFYAEKGLTCFAWTPVAEQPIEPLAELLTSRGFVRKTTRALLLTRWPDLQADPSVRILPARAMRDAFRTVYAQAVADTGPEGVSCVEAMMDRIDDPHLDMAVALVDGEPVGMMDLFQVGDIGFIKTAFIVEPHRRRGVATTLLAHAIEFARRLALPRIGTQAEDDATLAFFRAAGFAVGAEIDSFIRAAPTVEC